MTFDHAIKRFNDWRNVSPNDETVKVIETILLHYDLRRWKRHHITQSIARSAIARNIGRLSTNWNTMQTATLKLTVIDTEQCSWCGRRRLHHPKCYVPGYMARLTGAAVKASGDTNPRTTVVETTE